MLSSILILVFGGIQSFMLWQYLRALDMVHELDTENEDLASMMLELLKKDTSEPSA